MRPTELMRASDLRRDGAALRRLAAIVEFADDAIIGKTLEGTIESWNRAAERLYGYAAADVIGRSISLLLPPGMEDELPPLLQRIGTGERIERYETIRICKDGRCITVALTISPIRDEEGRITGAATIARDITAQKRDEEVQRMQSSMEATSLLAGGVAHDLNNLMTTVLGNAELLTMEIGDRPGVQDSLDAHQSLAVNLNEIVEQVAGIQKNVLPPGVSLQQDIAPDLDDVEADPTQMNQVLFNLTMNAMEAVNGNGSGEIAITTRNSEVVPDLAKTHTGLKPGPHVILSVRDSGCGMTPEVLSQVFKPFYSTKAQGRGLGLAAVYGILRNHDGYITAESKPGAGSAFTVFLPTTTRERDQLSDVPVSATGGNETILVVDDEAHILMINRRILEANGYHVLTARDGADALRVAREFTGDIHLVVLDLAMPVMDGAEAFTLLKQVRHQAKVILSSGYDLNDTVRTLLDAGADAFLQKPFRLTELTHKVRHLLDTKQEKA